MNNIDCYILAAGMGARMNSDIPKVLHKICGTEMINMVVKSAQKSGIGNLTVVVPKQHELHKKAIGDAVKYKIQNPNMGTGHALLKAKPDTVDSGVIVVLNGDIPLISEQTITKIIEQHKNSGNILTIATTNIDNPQGYGRILRNKSGEIKDLTRAGILFDTLPRWQKMEVQQEAQDQAYLSVEGADNNTARRWDNLSFRHENKQFDEELPGRLPSFLIDRDI